MEIGKAEPQLTPAEQARLATERAQAGIRDDEADKLQELQNVITNIARAQRQTIDMAIAVATKQARSHTPHIYAERIHASENSRETVNFIESVVDMVAASVVSGLEQDGYQVVTGTREVIDYRDELNAPPEYYETSFNIKW